MYYDGPAEAIPELRTFTHQCVIAITGRLVMCPE
jgi:hypothetical protein